jgi:hypothetical protein
VGGLSLPSNATHRDTYWNEVVGAVSPQRIVPIHWDSLMGSLSNSTAPTSNGSAGIAFVEERAQAAGIGTQTSTILDKADPFAGL